MNIISFLARTWRNFNSFILALWVSFALVPSAYGLKAYYLEDYSSLFTFRNPARLASDMEKHPDFFKFSFLNQANSNTLTDQFTYLSYKGMSLGMNFLNDTTQKNAIFYTGFGFPVAENFFVGTTLSFKNLIYGDLDIGVEWRQFSRLRLGVLLPGIIQDKLADFQITLLPSSGIQISLDAINSLSTFTWDNWDWVATAKLTPVRGVNTWLSFGRNNYLSVGASFQLDELHLQGGYAKNSTDSNWTAGVSFQNPSREKVVPVYQALSLKIDSSLTESKMDTAFFQKPRLGLIEVLNQFRTIESQPKVKMVFIHLESFPLGVAAALELQEAITKLRSHSKEVVVYLSKPKLKEFLIASSANQIVMEETDELNWQLPKSERYFLKGTMEKIGVEAELFAAGKYKSAPEIFTATQSSGAHKESVNQILDRVETNIAATLIKTKRLDFQKWSSLKSKILLTSTEAKKLGLIDTISTLEAEKDTLSETYAFIPSSEIYSENSEVSPRIAVITLEGDILEKEVRFLKIMGHSTITPKSVTNKLSAALKDPYTKGIILRISSGGGEVVASHAILKALEKAKQKKPIYVSMGDAAASGGYMIALGGNKIFSSESTLTGSIGVFLGKFNFKKLYEKIGLSKEVISLSNSADVYSEHRPWTAEEKKIFLERLQNYYDHFLTEVSTHRGKLLKKPVTEIAEGRVWCGKDASAFGLVDENKNFSGVVNQMAQDLELKNFTLWEVKEELNWKERIEEASAFGFSKSASPELSLSFVRNWFENLKPYLLFDNSKFLFYSPIGLSN